MALRAPAYEPFNNQHLKANDGALDFGAMEKDLAREMQKLRIVDDQKRREVEKACKESDEIKELQAKIRAAYLNKERAAQMAEHQFRKQQELVSNQNMTFQERDADIEVELLRRKEMADRNAKAQADKKTGMLKQNQ